MHQQAALAYLKLDRRLEALAILQDLADAFPDDIRVLRQVAQFLGREGQLAEAVIRWEQLAAVPDQDRWYRVEARMQIADLQVQMEESETAVTILDETLQDVRPGSWLAETIWDRIERVFQVQDDADGLVSYCRNRVEKRPEDLDGRLRLARAFSVAGERELAIAELRTSVELAPSRQNIREELMHQLVLTGAFEGAIDECEVLLLQNPDDADLLARLGELLLRQESGDGAATKQAISAWKRIADIRVDDSLYAVRAAELCRRSANGNVFAATDSEDLDPGRVLLIAAAEKLYREAITRSPHNSELYQYLGEFLHELGRREDAVEAFSHIATGEDADAVAWRRLADVYASVGYFAEAVDALGIAIDRSPEQFDWRVVRFDLLLEQEAFDRADAEWIELARQADTVDRQQIARERRVTFFRASERVDQEISRLQTVHSEDTASTEDLWVLALLLSNQWRHNEARDAFEAALATASNDVQLLRDYSGALQHSGDLARAVSLHRRAIALDSQPKLQDYEQMASLELRLGEYQAARETVQQLFQLAPDRQATFALQADLEFQTGAPEAGLAALRRAAQLAPREIAIRARLADALSRHGHPADAIEHYWRCLELTGDLDQQRSLVATMCVTGSDIDRDRIVDKLRRWRAQEEDPRAMTFCLVEALRSAERYDDARRELEWLLARGGRDLQVLRELAGISVQQLSWSDAADYQDQVATVTESADDLRLLLRYYRTAHRHDDATRVWERLLVSDDPDVYVDEVDRVLRDLDYDDAVSLAEIGLSKSPADWRLHLRAALAEMHRQRYRSASVHFEAAADATLPVSRFAPPDTGSMATTGHDDLRQELETAKSGYREFRQLITARQRGNTINWQRQLIRNLSALQRLVNADDAHVASVVGSFAAAGPQRGSNWAEDRRSRGETDRRFWRHLIWVYAATNSLVENREFVDTYIEQFSHDPLPHLARLDHARTHFGLQSMPPDDQAIDREGLIESYRWIVQNRPPLKAELVYKFGTDMLLLNDHEEAVSAFIDCLEHHSATVRAQAANSLRRTGRESRRSIPHLIERLSDNSPEVAIESTTTLGMMGPDAREAISPLIDEFNGDSVALRQEAAVALSRIGVETIPELTAALRGEHTNARLGAVLALYHLGKQAAPVMPDLIMAVHDDCPDVQRRAAMALANFGADAHVAVPDLIDCLGRSDSQLLAAAANTLASIGLAAQDAVPVLVALLNHDDPHIRHVTAHALRRIDPDAAEVHLGPLLDAVAVAQADIGMLDVGGGDWPQWGGWSGRNNTPTGTDIPMRWDVDTGFNIKWQVPLGSQTFGNPSVANGRVFIGTNNHHGYLPRFPNQIDLGVMLCFDEQTGSFLWQYSSTKLHTGLVHDWPDMGMPSTPLVDGERVWGGDKSL